MAGKKKEQKAKKEKPLDKWKMKELREEALKVPNIQGVHGMNKEELLGTLREAKGIPAPQTKKKVANIREIKAKIAVLKNLKENERSEGASPVRVDILRRKISRLKKQTRQ